MSLLLRLLTPDPPHPIAHARKVTFWTKDEIAIPPPKKKGEARGRSGERGVFFDTSRNKYYVSVYFEGCKYSRAYFATVEEAVRIRDAIEKDIGKT